MPISNVKPLAGSTPGIVIALDIIASLWALAAYPVGSALWQDDTVDSGAHVTLSGDNSSAITAIILCLLAATIAFGLGAVVNQLVKRNAAGTS
jgi:hypothetical protein